MGEDGGLQNSGCDGLASGVHIEVSFRQKKREADRKRVCKEITTLTL